MDTLDLFRLFKAVNGIEKSHCRRWCLRPPAGLSVFRVGQGEGGRSPTHPVIPGHNLCLLTSTADVSNVEDKYHCETFDFSFLF